MARTKSSASWLARHLSDPFVKQAQKDGYRSRSAYKLIELQEKDRLNSSRACASWIWARRPAAGRRWPAGSWGRRGACWPRTSCPWTACGTSISSRAISPRMPSCSSCTTGWVATVRPRHFRHRTEPHRHRFRRPGVVHSFPGAGARHRAQDLEAGRQLCRQDVPGFRIGPVREGVADALRKGADPQTGGFAQGVQREVYLVAKGFKG